MIQANEIVLLLLGIGVFIFILGNHQQLTDSLELKILISGFYLTLAGWILTVLEGFFWRDFLNLIEHLCYATSSVLVATWCFKVFKRREERK